MRLSQENVNVIINNPVEKFGGLFFAGGAFIGPTTEGGVKCSQ
jgi:hypothetical protein